MRATAEDVARLAGVSVSTVSRALAAPEKVNAATRQRVIEAADNLRYRPVRAASGLATGRTGNLGLVIPDLENPYFSALTKAVHARTHALGHQLFVVDTDEDPTQETEVLRKLSRDVDGVILCSPRAADDDLVPYAADVRLVTINRMIPHVPSVLVDDADGMAQAVRHLVALGHRDIAYAGGPLPSWSDRTRRGAFLSVTGANDAVRAHELGSFMPYFSGGVAAADLLLASPATAVVVFNDLMALGLLDRVKSRGVEVPGDLSIISFDNSMFAAAVTPHLTSVGYPRRLVARHAIDLLLALDDQSPAAARGQDAPHELLPTQLTVRASSGPASKPPRAH